MAKYDVTFKCGHTGTVELFGKSEERERKLRWYEKNAICPDCYENEKADGCKEVKMLYREYKENYADFETKVDSYDRATKTIIVYVPENEETSESDKEMTGTPSEIRQAKKIKANAIKRIELKLENAKKYEMFEASAKTIPMWEMALENINELFETKLTDAKTIIELEERIDKVVYQMEKQESVARNNFEKAMRNMRIMCGKEE